MRNSHKWPSRRLPPLNAICAFEACARLGSTVAAAAELRVTHGAISKQIAQLERWLDVALFDRGGVRLAPTAAGARYAAALGAALDAVERASGEVRDGLRGDSVVRVSTTNSFATCWLLPRLPAFRAAHPGIDVWISASQALAMPGGSDGVDVALRMGKGPWPGARAEQLSTERLVPVCAPALAQRLQRPGDLAHVTLLHDEDPRAAWRDWLALAGLGAPAWGERGPRVGDGALLLQAAAAGHGVALARSRLAAGPLREGRLVQPFGLALEMGPAYWLVLPARGTPLTAATRTFVAWIRHQFKGSPAAGPR